MGQPAPRWGMKLKTTLVARDSRTVRKVTIEVTTEAPMSEAIDSVGVRSRHRHTVDGAHKALRKHFHVEQIKIR